MDPTTTPTEVPTQDPIQDPKEETTPNLTKYVKDYKQAGKVWLGIVLEKKEQAYMTLFDMLLTLGDPYIDNFQDKNKQRVLNCIKDKSSRMLSEDEYAMYIEQEDKDTDKSKAKPKFSLTGDTREALKDYYDAVHA